MARTSIWGWADRKLADKKRSFVIQTRHGLHPKLEEHTKVWTPGRIDSSRGCLPSALSLVGDAFSIAGIKLDEMNEGDGGGANGGPIGERGFDEGINQDKLVFYYVDPCFFMT